MVLSKGLINKVAAGLTLLLALCDQLLEAIHMPGVVVLPLKPPMQWLGLTTFPAFGNALVGRDIRVAR